MAEVIRREILITMMSDVREVAAAMGMPATPSQYVEIRATGPDGSRIVFTGRLEIVLIDPQPAGP